MTRKKNLRIGMKNTRRKKKRRKVKKIEGRKEKERDGIRDRVKEKIFARRTIQKLSRVHDREKKNIQKEGKNSSEVIIGV